MLSHTSIRLRSLIVQFLPQSLYSRFLRASNLPWSRFLRAFNLPWKLHFICQAFFLDHVVDLFFLQRDQIDLDVHVGDVDQLTLDKRGVHVVDVWCSGLLSIAFVLFQFSGLITWYRDIGKADMFENVASFKLRRRKGYLGCWPGRAFGIYNWGRCVFNRCTLFIRQCVLSNWLR